MTSQRATSKKHSSIHREIDGLLDRGFFAIAFQPIIDLESSGIHGFEGLLRGPANTALAEPYRLFHNPEFLPKLLLHRLDTLCLERALGSGRHLTSEHFLFLNLHGETLWRLSQGEHRLFDLMETLRIDPARLVLEISENTAHGHVRAIARSLKPFRRQGVRVALDDIGARYAWLHHALWLEPNYLKIDRTFVQGLNNNPRKRNLIEGLTLLSAKLGAEVVAEGVENSEELQALKDLKVRFGQGFHLGLAESAEHWHGPGVQASLPARGLVQRPAECL